MAHDVLKYGALFVVFAAIGLVIFLVFFQQNTFVANVPVSVATTSAEVAAVDSVADIAAAAVPVNIPPKGSVLSLQKSGVVVDGAVISQTVEPPAGYVQYQNEKYGFSFYHLPDGIVHEYPEGAGAMSIVLENFDKVRGMQIYVLPYDQSTISEERFHKDVPSGVRKNVEETTLDGVHAVTFNSTDMTLGETREIWVIKGGYLYEINTFSGVGKWFTPIIQSWRWL